MPSAASIPRSPLPPSRSLRWRLPLLVAALISITLAAFLWAAYAQMAQTLGENGRRRAQSAADQLVNLMAASVQQRTADTKRVAADPALPNLLNIYNGATRAAAVARLNTLTSRGPQIIEVWNRTGDRVLALPIPAAATDSFPPPAAPTHDGLRLAQAGTGPIVADTIESVVDLRRAGAPLGYLVVRRPVSTSSPDSLNKLIGDGARVHLGAAGSTWTDLITIVPAPPVNPLTPGVVEYRAGGGEARVGALAQISGTPWLVSVDFPRAIFLAPARAFLYRGMFITVGLVVLAGVLSRVVTARMTTSVAALNDALEAVAYGDYSRRVVPTRSDELGRLGSAFNAMVAQVQEAQEHLTLAVQGSKVGIWEWNVEGDRLFLSAQCKQMLGYAETELAGGRSLVQELVHPDDWDAVVAGIRGCLADEVNNWESEHRLRRKDGDYIWVLARGVAIRDIDGQPLRLSGTSIDVTAQKKARDEAMVQSRHATFVADVAVALTEGGELRDMLTRCAQAMVEHLDASVARIWTASATEPVLELQATAGLQSETDASLHRIPIGKTVIGRVAAERRAIIDNAVDASQYSSANLVHDERLRSYAGFPLVLGDRLVGVISMFSRKPLTDSTVIALGSVARTVALGIERKRLDESRSRFEDLLESATDFVTIGRLSGSPLYVNKAARQALGLGPDDQVPSLFDFRPAEFRVFFESTVLPAALRDGMWKGQSEYVTRSGQTIPVSQVSIVHKDATGHVQYLSTISRDISEELRTAQEREVLQEQLQRTQRIEAIGQLAGGLAHDFNNLLTVILGYTNVLGDQFEAGDPRREDIEQIRRAGDRASQLTRQLLAFSRKQILNPVVLNPNDLISDIRPMLSRLLGEAITIVVNCDPHVSAIKFDPAQLELILVNLAVNARDAMPHGGTLTVDTADVDLDEEFCRTHLSVEPGHYVRLSVTDTGVGIDEATKKRVFEPFFTTKGRDKGTGLGLATVFGIVKQSGGSVWVYSEPGLGASFKIFLPVAGEPKALAAGNAPRHVPTGSETVLVVEDEAGVRGLVEIVLKRAGYKVLTASRPNEAIQIASDRKRRIDLLVTDVVMPDLNGAALSRQLCKARPSLRVLFMSGFADDIIENHGVLTAGTAFLQKPFSGSDLARKVRQVLDQTVVPATAPGHDS